MSTKDIAREARISFNSAKERIRKLEGRRVIQAYRLFIDLEKIGRSFYKALISTNAVGEDEQKKMFSFCNLEPDVAYLIVCFGGWDLEVEAEVEEERDFRELMRKFRNLFSGVITDYQMLHVYAQHKMNYFPMADELLGEI